MPSNPQAPQTEQTFLALAERVNAQYIPGLNAKLIVLASYKHY